MSTPAQVQIVSPAEYLPLRLALLAREKEHTRANDALAAARRALPVVEVRKPYTFTGIDASGNEKSLTLSDLFEGRRQLVLYHFMLGPNDEAGCHACSLTGDGFTALEHYNAKSTTVAFVSRAPIAKITAYKKRMGWPFPWYSSNGTDFNYDFHVTVDPTITPIQCNFMTDAELAARGLNYARTGDQPGMSCFIQGDGAGAGERGKVYHTYSGYMRQMEKMNNLAGVLDLTFWGRQDGGEKRKDEYTEEELAAAGW